jgi:glycosyltransferase involved in cell wall biosynthesis
MSRPKVAHVTTVAISLRGLLLNQMRSIGAAGYEVVGISAGGEDAAAVEAAGIRHIAVPMTRTFTPAADLVSLWRLYRVMCREGFTIVHTHTPKAGLLGRLAARLAGVPVVVATLHGFYFHDHMARLKRRFYVAAEKAGGCCADVILSQNREDVHTAVREGICPPGRIKYLGNGIDVRRFDRARLDPQVQAQKRAELGLAPGCPVVGFVGRLVAEKGIPELLRAAQRVLERLPATRFLFVGPIDREKPDVLRPETAREYGVADACVFTGRRRDMPELYGLMDVLVLPSHREGFPRAPMEASAMGVPCVVTDIRGCREAVEDGRNGLLVPLGDVPRLADAVLELLTDRDKAHRLGEAGRVLARERFDERRVFETVKAEYARLLAEKRLNVPPARPWPAVAADAG